ncbi:MAG: Hint domain-containing protein [Chitinophagaceae bacterium]
MNPRPLTLEEYSKARTFTVSDLDKDTYVKFENKYVLDRYEMRKPYFITGDDGLKKRIDLYKLYARDTMQEIGLVIYYTNEKNKRFTAVQPSINSEPAVWERYFEDIHAIDKEEKNFVLKLSYVLSKEMSFQLYKALNKEAAAENGTYGTEICFPGDQLVTMGDGSKKYMQAIQPGDQILTIDPLTKAASAVTVKALTEHHAEPYALTRLLLVAATTTETGNGYEVALSSKVIEATPNHPVQTTAAKKKIGDIATGEQLICYDEQTHDYLTYTVQEKTESAGKLQKVYNIVAEGGTTVIVNNVMVLQK